MRQIFRCVVVFVVALLLSSDVAAQTTGCSAYEGSARAQCQSYCDVKRCHVTPDPSCDQLRKNFAKKTGTSVFPCDATATVTAAATGTPSGSSTPPATETPIASATPQPSSTPTASATPQPSSTPTATPAQSACPATLVFRPNEGEADVGWTGIFHGLRTASDDVFTVELTGCASATPPCGICTVSGPIANTGPGTVATRRCVDATWIDCTTDTDCGASGPCVIFAGAPTSFSSGGVGVCVATELVDVGGTVDVESGDTIVNLSLAVQVESGNNDIGSPCPRCVDDVTANDGIAEGTCDDGLRIGAACDANATGAFASYGSTSLDCPPSRTVFDILPVTLPLTSATATHGLFCNTCNTGRFTACASSAECPDPPGSIGPICGGKRCFGGTNDGVACTANSGCPGGICIVPGATAQPNRCTDGVCTETTDDHGICAAGPSIATCQPSEPFRACIDDGDCAAGDTCTVEQAKCFPDNDGSISVTGIPDGLDADLSATPTLVGLTCVAGTRSAALNSVAGMPGLMRITVPVSLTASP